MEKEYKPGLTELRMNVKAFHSMADRIIIDLQKLQKEIQEIKNHNLEITKENIIIKQMLTEINAKLYEQGLR